LRVEEERARLVREPAPRGGDVQALLPPREQRHAEVDLEPVDLPAERRLRHVQARGGARDVLLIGDGDEITEDAQIQHETDRVLSLAKKVLLGKTVPRYTHGMDGWTARLGRALAHPRAMWLVVGLTACLCAPSLATGFCTDDYAFRAMATSGSAIAP